jgi:hypothetical protein
MFAMRVLRHSENFERRAWQLRTMIDDLKRSVLLLEADIASAMERTANPAKPAYHIATATLKDRRDNLDRTIWVLEGKLAEIGSARLRQTEPNDSHARV